MARARSSVALVTYRKRTHLYVRVPLSATLLPAVSLVEASKRVSGLMEWLKISMPALALPALALLAFQLSGLLWLAEMQATVRSFPVAGIYQLQVRGKQTKGRLCSGEKQRLCQWPPRTVTGVDTVLGNPCCLGGGENGNDWSVGGNSGPQRENRKDRDPQQPARFSHPLIALPFSVISGAVSKKKPWWQGPGSGLELVELTGIVWSWRQCFLQGEAGGFIDKGSWALSLDKL